jgi:predicted transglutaminase-like cysteine proteinase
LSVFVASRKYSVGAETMCQTDRTKAPTIAAFQSNFATIAAALIASCLLPQTTSAEFGNPREFKATVERVNFDMPAAVPAEFLALSRRLNAGVEGVDFDMRTVASVALVFPPLEFKAALRPSSVEPAAAPVKISTASHQIDGDKPSSETSPARAASYSLPRLEASAARINFDTPSLAPMSFSRFCLQYPQDCKVNRIAFRPRPVALTKERIVELTKVNRDVNRAIRPKANAYGVSAEEWQISPGEGDCKDYAVTKRHELLARGWPSRSLLLAEVVVPSGEHHVVLVVRTYENDFVLDNLNWNVRPVSQIGYQWVRAQQTNNPKFWSTVSVARSTRVAMNTR